MESVKCFKISTVQYQWSSDKPGGLRYEDSSVYSLSIVLNHKSQNKSFLVLSCPNSCCITQFILWLCGELQKIAKWLLYHIQLWHLSKSSAIFTCLTAASHWWRWVCTQTHNAGVTAKPRCWLYIHVCVCKIKVEKLSQ